MNTFIKTLNNDYTITDKSSEFITRARVDVGNGYELSVIQGVYSYGGEEGLYECAVMHNDSLCYDTPITDDVIGYCSESEVLFYLNQLKEFASTGKVTNLLPEQE